MTTIQKRQDKRISKKRTYYVVFGTVAVLVIPGLLFSTQILHTTFTTAATPFPAVASNANFQQQPKNAVLKKQKQETLAAQKPPPPQHLRAQATPERRTPPSQPDQPGRVLSTKTGTSDYRGSRLCEESTTACKIHFPLEQDSKTGKLLEGQTPLSAPQSTYLITRKGDKGNGGGFVTNEPPPPNQDRIVLFSSIPRTAAASPSAQDMIVVLADGHGPQGHDAAQQAITDLPVLLMNKLAAAGENINVTQAITEAFVETDEGDIQNVEDGGATGILVFRRGSKVYLASAGDSTALLGSYDGTTAKILLEARKHKPADPDERKRIEGQGGQVMLPPPFGDQDLSSRVLIGNMALAMSRCLGDADGKEAKVLTPIPTVREYTLSNDQKSNYFLFVSTDGVVDFLETPLVVEEVGKTLFDTPEKLPQVAQSIMDRAAEAWAVRLNGMYRDDMSLIVARL